MVVSRTGRQSSAGRLEDYEETQETLALLKMLAMARQNHKAGRTKPIEEVIKRLRSKYTKV